MVMCYYNVSLCERRAALTHTHSTHMDTTHAKLSNMSVVLYFTKVKLPFKGMRIFGLLLSSSYSKKDPPMIPLFTYMVPHCISLWLFYNFLFKFSIPKSVVVRGKDVSDVITMI